MTLRLVETKHHGPDGQLETVLRGYWSGKLRVAKMTIFYGDGVNQTLGAITQVEISSRFIPKKFWLDRGYLWRDDYSPAMADLSEPEKFIADKWVEFLERAALVEAA